MEPIAKKPRLAQTGARDAWQLAVCCRLCAELARLEASSSHAAIVVIRSATALPRLAHVARVPSPAMLCCSRWAS